MSIVSHFTKENLKDVLKGRIIAEIEEFVENRYKHSKNTAAGTSSVIQKILRLAFVQLSLKSAARLLVLISARNFLLIEEEDRGANMKFDS